jgi:hypothetical protein
VQLLGELVSDRVEGYLRGGNTGEAKQVASRQPVDGTDDGVPEANIYAKLGECAPGQATL